MKVCPECGENVHEGAKFCLGCGLIFFSQPAKPVRKPVPVVRPTSPLTKLVLVLTIGGMATLSIFRNPNVSFRIKTIMGEQALVPLDPVTAQIHRDEESEMDWSIELPGAPNGVAWNGQEMMMGKLEEPFGFIRLRRNEGIFQSQVIPALEAIYHADTGIRIGTWNGTGYVGYTEQGFFSHRAKSVFTIHDPSTLRVLREYDAPEPIGGIAWDGNAYWAGASKGSFSGFQEKVSLYRMDPNFRITNKLTAPAAGCNGLIWDGSYLWFAEAATSNLYVLNVKGVQSNILRKYKTGLKSLSGIAFDGENIWISEQEHNRIYRLNPKQAGEWLRKKATEAPQEPSTLEEMDTMLPTASYRNPETFPKNDVEVNDFSAEIFSNSLYGYWKIYFGEELFSKVPDVAKFTITVYGRNLSGPVAKVFDAKPAENAAEGELILADLQPGVYHIGLFVHVEYIDAKGVNRVLNRSIPILRIVN